MIVARLPSLVPFRNGPTMTPSEKWMIGLALVYSVPGFLSGIGVTLLYVRWPEVRRAVAMIPHFLSPNSVLGRRDFNTSGSAPADEVHSR